jgi:drug/metabolite transporter (DMT)-like permease
VEIALGPLLLVLVASCSSAGFDLARKLLGRHLAPVPMVVLLAAGSVPLFGLALLAGGTVRPAAGYLPPALGSVALNLAANLAFLQSVRLAPLSATVPLLSLTPAFTALLGLPLLGERPRAQAWLGIALVVAGACALNYRASRESRESGASGENGESGESGKRDESGESAASASAAGPATPAAVGGAVPPGPARSSLGRGVALMAAAALLWSVTIPLDKLAVRRASPAFHGLVLTAGIGLGAAAVLAGRRRLRELAGIQRAWPAFALALLTSTLTLGFQLLALRVVLVGVMETLKRGIGNLSAIALGRLVFGERIGGRQVAAALLMAGGVALIVL